MLGMVLEVDPEAVVDLLAQERLHPSLVPVGTPRVGVDVHHRLLEDHLAVEDAGHVAAGPIVLADRPGQDVALRVDRSPAGHRRVPELVIGIVGLLGPPDLVAVVGLQGQIPRVVERHLVADCTAL